MSPEQAARLTDIVARVVRGESGSGAELMDLASGFATWWASRSGAAHLRTMSADAAFTLVPDPLALAANRDAVIVDAWGSEEERPDLEGLPLDEAKARVTTEFEARGYVVLP